VFFAAVSLLERDAILGNVNFYYAAHQMMNVKLVVQARRNYSTIFIDPIEANAMLSSSPPGRRL
jgi:hypothetical protein